MFFFNQKEKNLILYPPFENLTTHTTIIQTMFSILGPWDFTQNSKRINVTQPGLGIYNVRNLLLSTNAQHQIWSDWMFQVYDKELWILFLSAIMLMILLLSVSYSPKFTWQNLLKAKMAAIKAILAQSFDQEIFLKVIT